VDIYCFASSSARFLRVSRWQYTSERSSRHVFPVSLNKQPRMPSGSSVPKAFLVLSGISSDTHPFMRSQPRTQAPHTTDLNRIYILPVQSPTSRLQQFYSPIMSLSSILTRYSLPHHTHKGVSNIDAGVIILATSFVSCQCVLERLPAFSFSSPLC